MYLDLLINIDIAIQAYTDAADVCLEFLPHDKEIREMFLRVRNDAINISKLIEQKE